MTNRTDVGCGGAALGFILFGILGLGVGLLTLGPFQAIGIALIASVLGAAILGTISFNL